MMLNVDPVGATGGAGSELARSVFQTPRFAIRTLSAPDLVELQVLFDANPDYFLVVNGRRPHADEAQTEFNEMPPSFLSYSQRWFAGIYDRPGALQGVLHLVSDLMAPRVWHIAFLFLSAPLRGTGAAHEVYAELESWVRRSGASWIRLGVVSGNPRAERFWARMGYTRTRLRERVDTGGKINDVRMLVKPLSGGSLEQYFALVPRDSPDSPSP